MATKKPFSISEYIQPETVSNLDHPAETEQIVSIPIGRIAANSKNFYDTTHVYDLIDSIALNGLLEPIIVAPDVCDGQIRNGTQFYRIISGHRRFKAFSQLAETEPEKYKSIPAIVREPKNQIVEELMLIEANRATRVMSSADTLKQAERYKELLVSLKEQGVEIPGRLRDVVAEAMNISASRLARLEVIRKGLIPEYAADFEENKINESAAYELARLSPAHQKQIHGNVDIAKFSTSFIPDLDHNLNIYFGPGLKCDRNREARTQTPGYCDHGAKMWEVSRKKPVYNMCRGCCADCYSRQNCKSVCPRVAPDVEKEKENRKKKDDEVKATRKQQEIERDNYVTTFWTREKAAREAAGMSAEDAFSKFESMSEARNVYVWLEDCADLVQQENGCPNDQDDDCWRNDDDPNNLDVVSVFADLYGCSIDYLMGRSDSLSPGSVANLALRWRDAQRDPPQDGIEILALCGEPESGFADWCQNINLLRYRDGHFWHPELPELEYPHTQVIGWIPSPLWEELNVDK